MLYRVRFRRPDGSEAWLGKPGEGPTDFPSKSPVLKEWEARGAADEHNRVHGPRGFRYWLVPVEDEKE